MKLTHSQAKALVFKAAMRWYDRQIQGCTKQALMKCQIELWHACARAKKEAA